MATPKVNRDWNALDGKFRIKLATLMTKIDGPYVGLHVVETYRTQKRQEYLYSLGRTRKGDIVTKLDGVNNISCHQKGLAADIWPLDKLTGKPYCPDADNPFWQGFGAAAEKLGLEWGGRWGSKDCAHVQLS